MAMGGGTGYHCEKFERFMNFPLENLDEEDVFGKDESLGKRDLSYRINSEVEATLRYYLTNNLGYTTKETKEGTDYFEKERDKKPVARIAPSAQGKEDRFVLSLNGRLNGDSGLIKLIEKNLFTEE